VPLDVVVEFKRGVYEMALTELARYLPKSDNRPNRYLRHAQRPRGTAEPRRGAAAPVAMELPPGASFDPHPQASPTGDALS